MWRRAAVLLAALLFVAGFPAAQADPLPYDWSVVVVQQPPPTMHPGLQVSLTIALRNEGTETWLADGLSETPVRLGTSSPRDHASPFAAEDPTWLWSSGRRIRMTTPAVPPGGIGTFTFTFRAPQTGSAQPMSQRLLPIAEPQVWMDQRPEIVLTTTVRPVSSAIPPIPPAPPVPSEPPTPSPLPTESLLPSPLPTPTFPPGYAWTPVLVSPAPATMHPGQKVALSVVLRNDGSETWHADNFAATPFRLAAVNAPGVTPRERSSAFGREDPTWIWSSGRRVRMSTPVVPPGGFGIFSFTFTAPAEPPYPKSYVERFAPIVEDVGLLEPGAITFSTQVRPASGLVPAIPEAPDVPPVDLPTMSPLPSPSDLPVPSEAPTPSPVPTPSDLPTVGPLPTPPPLPGATCPTTMQPGPDDLFPPALAAAYARSGTLLSGKVGNPQGIAYGLRDGKLYVTDAANDRVARSDLAGFSTVYFGSTGSGARQLRWPAAVALSEGGNIYVGDTGNDRISVWASPDVHLGTLGSRGSLPGMFSSPRGIQVIPNGPLAGELAIADTGNDRVQIISATGVPLAVIGTPGTGPGELSSPAAVSVWGDDVFVADTGNQRIVRFSIDGTYRGSWGGEGTDGGCTPLPTGVLANEYGVFVTESGGDRVEHFTRWGHLIETLSGVAGAAGVAIDGSANLYVTSAGSAHVARFSPQPRGVAPPLCRNPDPFDCFT